MQPVKGIPAAARSGKRHRIYIGGIDGYNNSLDVQNSKEWVIENLHVIPEVFEYQTVRASDEKGQITSRGCT